MSSAQDLLRLTALLDKKYTTAELDSMGWGSTSKGKLSHSGGTADGLAFVAMFPKDYVSNSGADLSEVHVAALTNVGRDNVDLVSLADKIALAVPANTLGTGYRRTSTNRFLMRLSNQVIGSNGSMGTPMTERRISM